MRGTYRHAGRLYPDATVSGTLSGASRLPAQGVRQAGGVTIPSTGRGAKGHRGGPSSRMELSTPLAMARVFPSFCEREVSKSRSLVAVRAVSSGLTTSLGVEHQSLAMVQHSRVCVSR